MAGPRCSRSAVHASLVQRIAERPSTSMAARISPHTPAFRRQFLRRHMLKLGDPSIGTLQAQPIAPAADPAT
jgi:hypothetical protein